jgi:hypothetical protein
MPDEKNKDESTPSAKSVSDGLASIEELRTAAGIKAAIHAGVVEMQGWSAGKKVSRAEYDAAVKQFADSPISNRSGK